MQDVSISRPGRLQLDDLASMSRLRLRGWQSRERA
jgi:hypothetical protein